MTATRTTITLTALALAGALLTGCSSTPAASAATPAALTAAAAATTAPAATTTPAPAAATTTPVATAGPYDQLIGGKLYQGTELAPVKIGADTPGQAPALNATLPKYNGNNISAMTAAAEAANKYLVLIGPSTDSTGKIDGYSWTVYAKNEYGNFRGVANQGGTTGDPYATPGAAASGPFIVDGRALDAAEFVLRSIA